MSYNEVRKMVGQSRFPLEYVPELQAMFDNEKCREPLWLMSCAFIYGTIVGKRQDRARRKHTFAIDCKNERAEV